MTEARCDDVALANASEAARSRGIEALSLIDQLLRRHPNDARLSFLRGSLLASADRVQEAVYEFDQAIQSDPTLHIARFQLGLLYATLRDATSAREAWRALLQQERDSCLAMFAFGLQKLLDGHLEQARRSLRAGIALNVIAPALSIDMERVVERIEAAPAGLTLPGSVKNPAHYFISEYLLGEQVTH